MKFFSKQVDVSDHELGCTITFSENGEAEIDWDLKGEEILPKNETYLLIQRTYPEDEFESDYHYFETSEEGLIGELKDFKILLSRNLFVLELPGNKIEIGFNLNNTLYQELKKSLQLITLQEGELTIND